MCPRGDDPETTNQHDFTLVIRTGVDAVDTLDGSFAFFWTGQTTSTSLTADASAGTELNCEEAFESLPNIDDVTCFITDVNSTTSACRD